MIIFCFTLFHTIKEKVRYKALSNIFILISEFTFFFKKIEIEEKIEEKHAHIFKNIVLKNFCKHYTLRSDKESALKVLKLS